MAMVLQLLKSRRDAEIKIPSPAWGYLLRYFNNHQNNHGGNISYWWLMNNIPDMWQ
jgi:hypothetical protein